jgi:hypothetical protein
MNKIIRNSFLYTLIRKYKAQKLDQKYKLLLNELFNTKKTVSPFNKERISSDRRLNVLGIGHLDWEEYGFWKAFEKNFNFSFFELKSTILDFNAKQQNETSRNILEKINQTIAERGNIDFVFFYCDSSYLAISLLKEIKQLNIKTVMMGLDDKHRYKEHRYNYLTVGQEIIIPYLDYYWTSWKSLAQNLNATGICKAIYLAEGADPDFHKNLKIELKDIDVLFLGNAYGVRKEIVLFLKSKGINIQAYGAGWENGFVNFDETINLYNRAKIVLGVGGVGHSANFKHLKGRDFEATMCGSCYITSYNPELADWFVIGKEILCYTSNIELLEQIHYLLQNDEERKEIAKNAYEKSIYEHTWTHRINSLIAEIYEIT